MLKIYSLFFLSSEYSAYKSEMPEYRRSGSEIQLRPSSSSQRSTTTATIERRSVQSFQSYSKSPYGSRSGSRRGSGDFSMETQDDDELKRILEESRTRRRRMNEEFYTR